MNIKFFRYIALVLLHLALASNLSGCAQAVMAAISVAQVSSAAIPIAMANSVAIPIAKASSAQEQKDANKKPVLTQLQTRQLQTRTYATTDTKKILQVALAVLQDIGFVVRNANTDIGLLSATKNLDDVDSDKGFFGFGSFSTVEATVTVRSFGKEVRVRLSARRSGFSGAKMKYEDIIKPDFYQDFFAKLEKGIFIEQQKL